MKNTKQKKSKVGKVDEVKGLKKVIKGLEEKMVIRKKEYDEMDMRRWRAENNVEDLEKELRNSKQVTQQSQLKLANIQKAIGTASAMRYPDARIVYREDTYYAPQAEPPRNDESEEVRLLRYLYELCN